MSFSLTNICDRLWIFLHGVLAASSLSRFLICSPVFLYLHIIYFFSLYPEPPGILFHIMASEIIEQEDEEGIFIIKTEAQKDKIRQIIEYQKSLYFASSSSSSYSSTAASCSSFASSRASNSLLDLMKEGNTSLRRLFDMEHTSLAALMKEYSGSPVIKPILLWGSDTDDGIYDDPWMGIKRTEPSNAYRSPMGSASGGSFMDGESAYQNRKQKMRKRKLSRTKTFRRLPIFTQWRCGGFRLRFRRVRIMICGRIF